MADKKNKETSEPTAPEAVEPAAAEAPQADAPTEAAPAAEATEPEVTEAAPAADATEPEATEAAPAAEATEPEATEAAAETPADDAPAEAPKAEETPSETAAAPEPAADADVPAENEPIQATIDLGKDARYTATGKRKRAIARVILKPGNGTITVNGREFTEYFPRPVQQVTAKLALTLVGYEDKMDVVARIHGGGTSAQAGALRHGISRALIEASPSMRGELKRRGLLTRDSRVKERKKAGLKKARKKPQFSKR